MLNRFNRCFSTAKKTCLHDLMLSHKGKIVDFAGIFTLKLGYLLPVQFSQGIIK